MLVVNRLRTRTLMLGSEVRSWFRSPERGVRREEGGGRRKEEGGRRREEGGVRSEE
jgi:hypothetical protein